MLYVSSQSVESLIAYSMEYPLFPPRSSHPDFELRGFETRMPRRKFGLKKEKITGDWIKLLKNY